MKVSILENQCYGSQRIEVSLTNGQKFTVMVNQDTGKVSLYTDSPNVIGVQYSNVIGLPVNAVPVEYYGYPSD